MQDRAFTRIEYQILYSWFSYCIVAAMMSVINKRFLTSFDTVQYLGVGAGFSKVPKNYRAVFFTSTSDSHLFCLLFYPWYEQRFPSCKKFQAYTLLCLKIQIKICIFKQWSVYAWKPRKSFEPTKPFYLIIKRLFNKMALWARTFFGAFKNRACPGRKRAIRIINNWTPARKSCRSQKPMRWSRMGYWEGLNGVNR